MSKFSKTSYPPQLTHNNFLNSMLARKEPSHPEDDYPQHAHKPRLDPETQPLHHLIEKKI